jgi:hypothetical protein
VLVEPKKRQIMNFELKDDSESAKSSSEDEETNNLLENLDDSDEEVAVFEEDEITGEKIENLEKSYKMSVLDDKIGLKMRLDE